VKEFVIAVGVVFSRGSWFAGSYLITYC